MTKKTEILFFYNSQNEIIKAVIYLEAVIVVDPYKITGH